MSNSSYHLMATDSKGRIHTRKSTRLYPLAVALETPNGRHTYEPTYRFIPEPGSLLQPAEYTSRMDLAQDKVRTHLSKGAVWAEVMTVTEITPQQYRDLKKAGNLAPVPGGRSQLVQG
jgi:hypothetical protein